MLADFLRDLRYGARALGHERAFTLTVLVTLALGLGANTAVFSVVDGVVLRPLPFSAPGQLVEMYGTPALRGEAVDNVEIYRQQSTSFDAIVGYGISAKFLRGPEGPERVMTVAADRDFFSMLGVAPLLGRTFDAGDGLNVGVVSERFWRGHLRADPGAVGSTVAVDGTPLTIVGVMPDGFQFPYRAASFFPGAAPEGSTELWVPAPPPAVTPTRAENVTARLKPGVSREAAAAELDVIAARIQAARPDPNGERGVRIEPLSDVVVTPAVRRPLYLLLGAVALVLALACANVTNLSLVRMTNRHREVAVRAALGASPGRIMRQLAAESLLLALAGGATGLFVAGWGTGAVRQLATNLLPRAENVGIDWRVFLFAALAAGAAALSSLVPVAALATKSRTVLHEPGSRSTLGKRSARLRNGLVVVEIALAFALAVGAALLVRELVRLRRVDAGMSTANVVTFHVGGRPDWWGRSGATALAAADARQFYEIARRVAALPGVRAAGFIQLLPLQNWGWTANTIGFTVRGSPVPPPAPFQIDLRYVTPGYFQALGISIRRGRTFTEGDAAGAPRAILVNDTLARMYFGAADPLGADTTRGTIVGVVGDVRESNLDRPPAPTIYYPIAQNYSQVLDLGLTLVVRASGATEPLVAPVRAVVREVTPNQAVFNVKTMDEVVADSMADFRLYLWLMATFAALALALALVGTYGVLAYTAASRMREFAVRVALGASRPRVVALVVGQGAMLTGAGLLGGVAVALAAAPFLRSLPVGVRPPDLRTLGIVALAVVAVAMAACLPPGLRAGSADPARALRDE